MKKILLSLSLCLSLVCFAEDTKLLTDLISGSYNAKKLSDVYMLNDSEQYAILSDNKVFAYALDNNKLNKVLFSTDSIKGTNVLPKDIKIQGYVVSPNERYVLIFANKRQVYRRSFVAQYYVYDSRKRTIVKLSDTPVQDPVFSPDSRYIAFVRDNNIYIHKLDFGTEVAVTIDGKAGSVINGATDWLYEEEFGITCTYSFSPDSKQLAFIRFDESNVPTFTWQEMLNTRYPESYSLKYPKAGEENAKVSVVVYDTYYKSLKTMKIDDADIYIPRIRWTNSSDALAIFKLNRNQNKLEMYIANPKSTESKVVYTEENSRGYVDYSQTDEWQWLTDGSFIVVNETSGYRHVYQYSAVGKRLRQLTSGKYDVTCCYGYDESTGMLYYQAADQNPMTRNLFALNTKKNKTIQLNTEEGWHEATFSSAYGYYIDAYQSLTHATSYTLYNNIGKKVDELMNNDDVEKAFKALCLPEKEFFQFTTSRGDTLNGWMLLPMDFDAKKQYPVLQVQYSGPGSQQVYSKWNKRDWEYFLATQGIIVVCADPRGTCARGKDWQNLTYMNLGVMEAQDQVSLAQYMQSLPYVRADRIGIWGWSYGGFMTIMSMSQPEGIFHCGIAVAPVTDFRLYDSAYTERFMRRPQSNSAYVNCALPLMADRLRGDLLICHGIADDNVHCQHTWQYIEALVQAGIQFEMQMYPDDNHFLRKRSNYKHLYERKWRFLQQELLQ